MPTRRVTYHGNVGDLSVDDVADMMEASRGHHIVVGTFLTGRDAYLNILHGIGDRKFVWINIEVIKFL